MERNRITNLIARRVSAAIIGTGTDIQSVASAADITTPELRDRLNGRVEFGIGELVDVSGFLRVPVNHFIGGAA